jgi:hypothetical protein
MRGNDEMPVEGRNGHGADVCVSKTPFSPIRASQGRFFRSNFRYLFKIAGRFENSKKNAIKSRTIRHEAQIVDTMSRSEFGPPKKSTPPEILKGMSAPFFVCRL